MQNFLKLVELTTVSDILSTTALQENNIKNFGIVLL